MATPIILPVTNDVISPPNTNTNRILFGPGFDPLNLIADIPNSLYYLSAGSKTKGSVDYNLYLSRKSLRIWAFAVLIKSNISDKPSAPPTLGQQPLRSLPDFFHDCDDLINCKSNKPTRHTVLHTTNVTTPAFKKLFMMGLEAIISYYRMKHAEQAVNYINRKYYSLFQAHYAKSDLFKKPFEQELLVRLNIQSNTTANYMQQLSGVGSIYSIL
ncbi:hypothetical protein BD770DRAFT_448388 [Pilaira anomala]|nr:hypothetical protein BD770DRAFT_448388 [Pilaira anomala]